VERRQGQERRQQRWRRKQRSKALRSHRFDGAVPHSARFVGNLDGLKYVEATAASARRDPAWRGSGDEEGENVDEAEEKKRAQRSQLRVLREERCVCQAATHWVSGGDDQAWSSILTLTVSVFVYKHTHREGEYARPSCFRLRSRGRSAQSQGRLLQSRLAPWARWLPQQGPWQEARFYG
jgi:hypothetical protein